MGWEYMQGDHVKGKYFLKGKIMLIHIKGTQVQDFI